MKYFFTSIIFCHIILTIFSSCNENREYLIERNEELNKNPFDQNVIHNVDEYEKIRNLLIENQEEFIGEKEYGIISFDYKKKSVRYQRQKVDSLPPNLKEVEILVRKLGTQGIFQGVTLHKDSSTMFVIKSTYVPDCYSNLNRNLLKGKKYKIREYSAPRVGKDTLINQNWIYRIHVDRRYGMELF